MDRVKKLDVFYHDRLVGTMALYNGTLCAFEYSKEWLTEGFSISPFSLPLEKGVFMPKIDPFEGLFGVFADSLPDGWGRLLVDRLMRKKGIDPFSYGNMERLAIVGETGMGALTYRPVIDMDEKYDDYSLDEIAKECEKILLSESSDKLDYLFAKGGSSGGARPKILTKVDEEDWIIKFPATFDDKNIGKQEYEYALCARECGINLEEVRLFDSEDTDGYFGMKRFDRVGNQICDKVHMVSAAGLLETSHRTPNLDYNILMRLTLQLTGSMEECEQLFRRMCFNVYAHNRDDHAKNFSFLYEEEKKCWRLSPAYDLTYSTTYYGEHTTTVAGNGKNPGSKELIFLGTQAGLSKEKCRSIAVEIKNCVSDMLSEYLNP